MGNQMTMIYYFHTGYWTSWNISDCCHSIRFSKFILMIHVGLVDWTLELLGLSHYINVEILRTPRTFPTNMDIN